MLGIQLCGGASNPVGRKCVSAGLLRSMKSSHTVVKVTLQSMKKVLQGEWCGETLRFVVYCGKAALRRTAHEGTGVERKSKG